MTTRALRELFWFSFFALLTIAVTWPWILHIGRVPDPYDPYMITWILAWDYHQTFKDPLHLFDANIFYPLEKTLALSEHMYGVALPLFPFFALGLKPLQVHGIGMLLAYTLCGYGMFRLTRTATGSTAAGVISGIAFAFVPFRLYNMSQLTYVSCGWIPLTLEAIILFIRSRTWKRAIWLGVAFLFNGLSCLHWFTLTLIPFATAFFLLAWAKNLLAERALWIRSSVAIAIALMALVPFFYPYRVVAKKYGTVRSIEELPVFSARPRDWLVAEASKHYGERTQWAAALGRSLFPGLGMILLAGAAVFLTPRRKSEASASRHATQRPPPILLHTLDFIAILLFIGVVYSAAFDRFQLVLAGHRIFNLTESSRPLMLFLTVVMIRWWLRLPNAFGDRQGNGLGDYLRASLMPEIWVAWSWVAFGFLGSLGTYFAFHRVLYDLIPIFRGIRVPSRWCYIAYVGLSFLAGLGAVALAERISKPWMRQALVGLLAMGLLFEFGVPAYNGDWLFKAEVDPPPVYQTIKELPMKGGLVELPYNDAWRTIYTLRAADHFKPLVTAYSSYYSPQAVAIEYWTEQRPIPDKFLDELEAVPTSYLIVHEESLDMDMEAQTALHQVLWRGIQAGRIGFVKRFQGGFGHRDDLYAIMKNEPSAQIVQQLPWTPPEEVPIENQGQDDAQTPAPSNSEGLN